MFTQDEIVFLKSQPAETTFTFLSERAVNAGRYDLKPIFASIYADMGVDVDAAFNPNVLTVGKHPHNATGRAFLSAFPEFLDETVLGELVENIYYDGKQVLINETKTSQRFLIYLEGNLYERIIKEEKNDDGEEQEVETDKLISALGMIIRNIYIDGNQTYIQYRLPLDRQDKIEEFSMALDKIKTLAYLSTSETHALWKLLTEIAPSFFKLNKAIKLEGFSVHDGKIEVTVDPTFNKKEVLEQLVNLYNLSADKNAFNFMLLYAPFSLMGYEFRKRNYLVQFVIYYGGGEKGKSILTRKFVVNGLNNEAGDLTEQDIYTLAAFRDHMSSSIYPRFIDEVSMYTMMNYSSHLKAMTTGKGTASRGRRTGGHNQWETLATPFFVSNEYLSDQYAFNRRAFMLIAESEPDKMQPSEWRKVSKKIPDGFLYIFLAALNGKKIDSIIDEVTSNVEKEEDYTTAYLAYMLKIVKTVYAENGVECPFHLPKKEEAEYRWEEIFQDYLVQQKTAYERLDHRDRNSLIPEEDYRVITDGNYYIFQIKRIGYEKFLNAFHRCPYKDMKTFALNAGTPDFSYSQKHWGGRVLEVKVKKNKGYELVTDTSITV
ncbi:MAG: hypothetical protein QXL94_00295 [Candidatus Parvarchaeum sp.]